MTAYPVRIRFTPSELCREYENAEMIVNECTDLDRTPNFGFQSLGERIGATFIGRLGELALAKYLDVPYELTGYDRHAFDVADRYEVRTRRRDHYDLFTYDTDKPALYVLATTSPDYVIRLRGWIPLHEANVPEHWTTKPGLKPCYLTPQARLYPMTALPKETRHNGI